DPRQQAVPAAEPHAARQGVRHDPARRLAARAGPHRQARARRRARQRRPEEGAAGDPAARDMTIAILFDRLLDRGGSDLHLAVGYPPMLRVRGDLIAEGERALAAADIDALLQPLLTQNQAIQFALTDNLDFAYAHGTKARFRANYLRKTTGPG